MRFLNIRNDEILLTLKTTTGMSGRKFRRMVQCIRLYDKTVAETEKWSKRGQPSYDSQHKVRPFLAALVRGFQKHISPGRHVVVDESMDKCTGRCGHKHKIPRKPIKEGLKYLYLCEERGCVINIDLYTKETLPYDATKGPLFSRVFMLLSGQNIERGVSYLNKYKTVFLDRLFTSVDLAVNLLPFKTMLVGTCVASRKYLPTDICKEKMNKNILRGSMIFRHAEPLRFVSWYDNNVVKILYNDMQFVEQVSVIQRRKPDTSKVELINVPEVVKYYQQYMRGVDLS